MKNSARTQICSRSGSARGFTLIELSIVLVIIGLIVGGVLVGRDLIEAAQIRSTISKIEQIKAAVNTFRLKYNALPGDIASAKMFGFPCWDQNSRDGTFGKSDGNGMLDVSYSPSYSDRVLGGEMLHFWRDLAFAGLIPDAIDVTTCGYYADMMDTDAERALNLPRAGDNSVTIYRSDSSERMHQHFYALGKITTSSWDGIITNWTNAPPYEWGLTPLQAQAIDSKMDDGNPSGGNVQARAKLTYIGRTIPPSAIACVISATAYNTATAYASQSRCWLDFAAGF